MKIKLLADLPGVGKAGKVVKVSQQKGCLLACQGACEVVEHDVPSADAVPAVLKPEPEEVKKK